jgi:hypothetical protein
MSRWCSARSVVWSVGLVQLWTDILVVNPADFINGFFLIFMENLKLAK